jgi:hypothetical protein
MIATPPPALASAIPARFAVDFPMIMNERSTAPDNLDEQAAAALAEARAMPPGLARTEAIKRAGALRAAVDKLKAPSFARRGRPPK